MINYERSHPAPDSLSAGNYNTQDILDRLVGDAKNKCYLCESLGLVSVNTEHLVPHRGDKTLRLDWENLLLSCAHCNSTKGDYERFHPVLDPCDFESRIIEGIEHSCEPWPTEKPTFIPVRDDEATQKTVALLTAIFHGTTVLKKLEAHNLREELVQELADFQQLLLDYFKQPLSDTQKSDIREKIRAQLSQSSSFCAFKIWAVRSRPLLDKEFGEFYREHQPIGELAS